jgi:hypothetical protein
MLAYDLNHPSNWEAVSRVLTELYPPGGEDMKYRAKLIEPGSKRERPLQVLGNNYDEMSRWAGEVLKGAADGSVVNIYGMVEQQIALIPKARIVAEEVT